MHDAARVMRVMHDAARVMRVMHDKSGKAPLHETVLHERVVQGALAVLGPCTGLVCADNCRVSSRWLRWLEETQDIDRQQTEGCICTVSHIHAILLEEGFQSEWVRHQFHKMQPSVWEHKNNIELC
jgi:hypothetical protein